MLALFGLFAAIGLKASIGWWIVGFICVCLYPLLALYGLIICIALGAPWWAYVLGFIALIIDMGTD